MLELPLCNSNFIFFKINFCCCKQSEYLFVRNEPEYSVSRNTAIVAMDALQVGAKESQFW